MRFVCWVTKATDTHSEYVILIAFDGSSGYANAPEYYVIRALPVLLSFAFNREEKYAIVRLREIVKRILLLKN